MSDSRPAVVVVLAAGQGTRMKSATAKVLHTMCGRTLLGHVHRTDRDGSIGWETDGASVSLSLASRSAISIRIGSGWLW